LITRKGESKDESGADNRVVSTAAAPPALSGSFVDDERVRAVRERDARARMERVRRQIHLFLALAVLGAAGATAATLHAGPSFSWLHAAAFTLLFAALARVLFETGDAVATPTGLALVPMLFALPLGVVPAVVIAGFLLSHANRMIARRSFEQALPLVVNAIHAFGPVLVLAVAHGLPLSWSRWPVYVGALAAQLAVDIAVSRLREVGTGLTLATIARYAALPFAVDAALAPIGLAFAIATRPHPELVVLALPLVLLLRHFSGERKRRIDHAIELSDAYRGTAFLLGDVVEADDEYTGDHSRHVVDLVLAVSDDLQLEPADRRVAEFVALLHDVGKIKIPNEIIVKPGPLTAEERALIETHTIEGERLLDQVGGLLAHVGRVVRSCHEHWDGSGYPDGLAGEEIPLVARIVCACDAFSAMTTDRPYRAARSEAEALAEMRRCAGTHFDPQVVAALCRALG
jgi:HD-GYP domain-containing protein (c-di-GMP phosphodiesterase class II)